jgi:hypothetical protein
MRSSRAFILVSGAAILAACGGGDGGTGNNNPPTAAFAVPVCTQLACTFDASGSTDDGSISTYAWNFGDANSGSSNTGTGVNASHTFSAANTYTVTLTVTDNAGETDDVTRQVTVTGAPGNQAPAADFTPLCSALDCTFTDASTDADGTIASRSWDFGDGSAASTETSPSHTYNVTSATTFHVALTVTDNQGATNTKTRDINVAPAAGLTCNGQDCTLDLPVAATVVVTLVSHDCEVHNNKVVLTAPIMEELFLDGCYDPASPAAGSSHTLNGGAAFAAGTHLAAEVRSGFSGTTQPQLRVTGDFASGWTLEYDDGFVGPGEPDFNDLVLRVVATP